MGFYGEHIVPRILDKACGLQAATPFRQRVCAGLSGEVVEIGFGSGLNLPHYPATVASVAAVDPSDVGWKLAGTRLREATVPVFPLAQLLPVARRCRVAVASMPAAAPPLLWL